MQVWYFLDIYAHTVNNNILYNQINVYKYVHLPLHVHEAAQFSLEKRVISGVVVLCRTVLLYLFSHLIIYYTMYMYD